MLDKVKADGFWFLDSYVTIPVAQADNKDGLSVIRVTAPGGAAPPLHVHHHEDEVFHILDGELRFRIGEAIVTAYKGDTVLAPQGVPHGYRVLSEGGAAFLVITRGGFETLVRSVSRPALSASGREPAAPTPAMQADLAAKCLANGIEVLGPPIA